MPHGDIISNHPYTFFVHWKLYWWPRRNAEFEGMLFYTCLESHTDFLFVLHSLGPAAYHQRYLYNQVQIYQLKITFFTLIKLWQNKLWIESLIYSREETNFWPDRDTVNSFHPVTFFINVPLQELLLMALKSQSNKKQNPLLLNIEIETLQLMEDGDHFCKM